MTSIVIRERTYLVKSSYKTNGGRWGRDNTEIMSIPKSATRTYEKFRGLTQFRAWIDNGMLVVLHSHGPEYQLGRVERWVIESNGLKYIGSMDLLHAVLGNGMHIPAMLSQFRKGVK